MTERKNVTMKTKKKGFSFYRSYYDVYKELTQTQKVLFIDAITSVEFLEVHVDKVEFKDKMLTLLWKSLTFSIKKQVEGYCNANKVSYNSLFIEDEDTIEAPSGGGIEAPLGEEEGEVQEQEKEEGLINAALRSANLSQKLSKDNKTHRPNGVLKELESKHGEDLDDSALLDLVLKFVIYRDEMYSATKDKKYALKTIRSIIGFINEIVEVKNPALAFSKMEDNEWATFKREWIKGEI